MTGDRLVWRVELVQPPAIEEKPVEVGETLQVPRSASGVLDTWEVQAEPVRDAYDHVWIANQTTGARVKVSRDRWRDFRGDFRGERPGPTLHVTALTPDGRDVLQAFDAGTPEAMRAEIERSGLVASVSVALWLGDEIRKAWGRP